MSANIDTMMYVKESPWHGLGHRYEEAPSTPQEIITAAELDWRVNSQRMKTDMFDHIPDYHAIYREDKNQVLGVVNRSAVQLVQNIDTFNAFETILGKEVTIDTAASLGTGQTVFGCFKINEGFKVLDDEVDHYFVVMNEHTKSDGKVTILNTPIRVVCQNTLSAALDRNNSKIRIPISNDKHVNADLARRVINSGTSAITNLSDNAEEMIKAKISKQYINTLLDEFFPYIKSEGGTSHDRANEKVEIIRNKFVSNCMGADDLSNYRGTQYQVFSALTDFTQHYFTNPDKAYDINHRMKLLPGIASDSPSNMVAKYMKIKDKIAA